LCFVLLAGLGCAGLPPVPSKGGPRWLRLETEHFVLYSDQAPKLARTTITQFERWLSAYLQTGWQSEGKLALKLNVIVMDDRAEFEHLFGTLISGSFERSMLFEPLVVMPRTNRSENWATLKHEVTHYIAQQALIDQPVWLAEGLATYFETAYEDPSGAFVLGAVPRARFRRLGEQGRMSVRELFAARNSSEDPRVYESSWLLVHCLMSEHAAPFAKFQALIATGKSVDASWSEAFPALPLAQLDAVLDRYAARGVYVTYATKVQGVAPSVQTRALTDADVYAVRAVLYLTCQDCGEPKRPEVDRNIALALAADPGHLRALALRANRTHGAERLAVSRDLVRLHPSAWLSWVMLANAELDSVNGLASCDAEVPVRLVSLAPTQPYALGLAAQCELRSGREQNALDWSERAVRLRPASTSLLLQRAEILQALSRCTELAALLPRLENGWHEPVPAAKLEALSHCPVAGHAALAGHSP
jgi:hypothetical protein